MTHLIRFYKVLGVGLLLSLLSALANAAEPDYRAYHGSFFIPYAEGSSYDEVLRVKVRINGGPVTELVVDTGSSNLVVGTGAVGTYDPSGPPLDTEYTSDGQVNHGVMNELVVEFVDARGLGPMTGQPAISRLPGQVVTRISCKPSPYPTACHPADGEIKTHMMGIGFGPLAGNAVLNLDAVRAGQLRAGYILEPHGIRVGLTGVDVGRRFRFVKLERPQTGNVKQRLWAFPQAMLSVQTPDGAQSQVEGRFLMDTGIRGMLAGISGMPHGGQVPEGTAFQIQPRWIGEDGPTLGWVMGDGETSPLLPSHWVRVFEDDVTGAPGPFINTGIRPINGHRYLYDAEGGYWGLAPR